ncbi:hypothetical protein ACFWAN_44050 [Streptomyces mirabilis]|uniref:hypothetical protein n=1 Tax=Streptomyces mirabilis TaxID=68239 RepID=UPI003666CFC1
MTTMDQRPPSPRTLIDELEGHLLIEAAKAEGRTEAARFTHSLACLTDTQREEVEERFADSYLALTRRSWERTARRGRELRAEYEARYRALRRRLCVVLLLGAAFALVAFVSVSRR